MEKISVTVKIPALGNTYDFMIPSNMSIRNVQKLIIRILNSEYGILDRTTDCMLIDMNDCRTLRLECSLIQLGISDGAKLMLI